MNKRTKHTRGSVRKSNSKLVAVWLPTPMVALIDRAVETGDTDRSKFIREAIRRHCGSSGQAA